MDRVSLAFIRVMFFIMLFISTACNKMDRSILKEDLAEATPAMAAQASAADAARLRQLEGRVAMLEAELKIVNRDALAAANVPGGANWD